MRRANIKIMVLAGLLAVCWAGLRSAAANDLESIGVTRQGDSIAVTITSSTACGYNAFMTDTKPERIVVDFIAVLPKYEWTAEKHGNADVEVEKKVGYRMQTNVHLSVPNDDTPSRALSVSDQTGRRTRRRECRRCRFRPYARAIEHRQPIRQRIASRAGRGFALPAGCDQRLQRTKPKASECE